MRKNQARPEDGGFTEAWDNLRRAFAEFLLVPTCVVLAFILLATGVYALDRSGAARAAPFHSFLQSHIFADAKATSDLLGAIAGSIITMASLTITLLLIVVQQTASSMTAQVYDQFLRRRHNQVYFGFFVGLALYALVILATVDAPFNPVYGAGLALLLAVAALYLLLVLIYTTINQMRPAVIIEAIHGQILSGRHDQLSLIRRTQREPLHMGGVRTSVRSRRHGFVTRVDLACLEQAIESAGGAVEIVLNVSIGSYVAFQDVTAFVTAPTLESAAPLEEAVTRALHLEGQRDLRADPAFGIQQLQTIAWTSISSSKSNPAPGLLTIYSLHDILAHWAQEETEPGQPPLPVVYTDDVSRELMDTFETLAVASTESMQHQNFIAVARTMAIMFDRLPPDQQRRVEDLVLRILSAMGDLVLTAELDRTLTALSDALATSGSSETASAVQTAHARFRLSIGKLNSRSTRVPTS